VTPERIAELGRLPFLRDVTPLKRELRSVASVYGLDTEYDRAGRLVCWTVSGPGGDELFTSPLSVAALESHALATEPTARAAVFVSFFSLAELQFFDLVADARELRVYGRGSTDVKFKSKRVDVSIVDVARFFDGQPLKKAAAAFGLTKRDYDVTDVTPACLRDPVFRDYALHDARIARIIFERLRDEWLALGIDLLCYPTAASAAAALWRRRDLQAPLARPPHQLRRLGLHCAWGGRAEAFRRGSWSVATELDLKSAYPRAVLSYGAFPAGDEWRAEHRLRELLDEPFALAVVDFAFPRATMFPCLPVMHAGRMLFPLRGRSACTGDELRLAQEMGAKLVVVRGMAAAKAADDSAQRFMAWALETREKVKGTARAFVAKLAANSLTGKWVQNRDGVDMDRVLALAAAENVRPASLFQLGPTERRELGLVAQPMLGGAFWPESYALTTGRVRALLGRELWRNGRPLYCATDSVWTEGKATPPTPEWDAKLVGPAVVVRTRLARIEAGDDEHLAFHGVASKEAARELLARFSLSAPEETEVAYDARRPIGLKEGVRRDLIVGRWMVEKGRRARTDWDGKRRLVNGETSVPWETIHDAQPGGTP
jgi:hypothetical protein